MSLALFHEVSLPVPLALAASGGPERRVETVTLSGGQEARNAAWAGSRRRWDIGSAAARIETLQALIAFFEARGGRLYGFRFRDMLDDRSGPPGAEVSSADQATGIGDGARREFALVKHYGGWARRIWKPVAGSVRVAVDGAEAAFAVDVGTGLVTLDTAPGPGALIVVGEIFQPGAGLEGAEFVQGASLAPGRAAARGALRHDAITEEDLEAGLWDGARVDVWRVDWQAPEHMAHVWSGRLSEVTRGALGFEAQLVSLKADLERPMGRIYARRCDAVLGDARCGVDVGAFPGAVCDHRFETCRSVFGNAENFRGFPHLPGADFVLAGPAAAGNDGGKR